MKNQIQNQSGNFFLDPLFDLFSTAELPEPRSFRSLDMKTDIKEEGEKLVMEVEMPGVNKKDISVSLSDGYLSVEASVNANNDEKDKKGNYIHRERFSGVASRNYYVGDITLKDVSASFENGILTISFPKEAQKKAETQNRIEIK
jgi:HSP20 family protein